MVPVRRSYESDPGTFYVQDVYKGDGLQDIPRGTVKRIVPRENESINETWIPDRDRFSYEGIYSGDRLQKPMAKDGGEWRELWAELAASDPLRFTDLLPYTERVEQAEAKGVKEALVEIRQWWPELEAEADKAGVRIRPPARQLLPDGELHPEAAVTRSSLHVFMARMCADIECSARPPWNG